MRLKVAIVQINSKLGQSQHNITKINNLLSKAFPTHNGKNPDLVVLSELAITGYNFASAKHIEPFLESCKPPYGASLGFARELSLKYGCFTVVGYPERGNAEAAEAAEAAAAAATSNGFEHTSANEGSRLKQGQEEVIYNSCAVFNRSGELIHNYRKTFLYETDEQWGCLENPHKGFPPVQLSFNKKEMSTTSVSNDDGTNSILTNFGICMDLNPYKFEAPFNKFEFSAQCYHNKSRLIICPMAWLSQQSPSIKNDLTKEEKLRQAELVELPANKPNMETINYWILRFFPFLAHKYSYMPKWWSNDEKVSVLISNRVGREEDVIYGGSSCILQFNNGTKKDNGDYDAVDEINPSVEVIGKLSQAEEGVLVEEIEV
ncbi:NTA1 [Candida theae]|uniref:NTA1 n=1 Tax=Candida theae TaxID=1198502 RepID=A0AAD5BEF4_9ASCO|nr:NTA1 [Candida theae]KAI5957601.1 NTA1 [Candida theae]